VAELGLVIYGALDFGIGENEERTISEELSNLLEFMTGACGSQGEGRWLINLL